MMNGGVTSHRVARDGVRVRAGAGSGPFRRRKRLQEFLKVAEEQVSQSRKELEDGPAATSRRSVATRQRAARERQERVSHALKEMESIEARRRKRDAKGKPPQTPPAQGGKPDRRPEPRASIADPRARAMKGPAGGFRPSYYV